MDPLALLTRRLFPARPELKILEIDLDLGVLSAPPDNPMQAFRALNAPTMRAIRDGLRSGRTDDSVVGLVVHVGTAPLDPAQLDELGAEIQSFGEAKPTLAYSETFGEMGSATLAYKLAVNAQQVWVQPTGELGLNGTALAITLLRGGLDKLGVEPQFGQRYEYKTAANTYAAHEVTPAHQEMMQRIADSITEEAVQVISGRRGLSSEAVWAAVNSPSLTAAQALAGGFVDALGYRDEVYAHVRSEWGSGAAPGLKYAHRYGRQARPLAALTERGRPGIAVVTVRGAIVSGRGRPGGPGGAQAGAELVGAHLRAAVRDESVKAVVLRVDSPGGSYVASDAIRREVLQVRESGRPVVASMGSLAASGGYFVSMPANEIVAAPTTLTGSIGVLAGKFVTAALKRKLGLVSQDVASGEWSTVNSGNVGFTPEQWAALDERLDEIYADFTTKAAADRGLTLAVLEPLARGRVWTGADALGIGLVDHLGGMGLALERAAILAGLEPGVPVKSIPAMPLLEQIRPADSSESSGGFGVADPSVATSLRGLAGLGPDGLLARLGELAGLSVPGVLTMPYRVEIR